MEQPGLHPAPERLDDRVVEAIADRPHGEQQTGVAGTAGEGPVRQFGLNLHPAKQTRSTTGWETQAGSPSRSEFPGNRHKDQPRRGGWINYYGRCYKSRLIRFLAQQINPLLAK